MNLKYTPLAFQLMFKYRTVSPNSHFSLEHQIKRAQQFLGSGPARPFQTPSATQAPVTLSSCSTPPCHLKVSAPLFPAGSRHTDS